MLCSQWSLVQKASQGIFQRRHSHILSGQESEVLLHINYKSISIPRDRELKWLNTQIQSYCAREYLMMLDRKGLTLYNEGCVLI